MAANPYTTNLELQLDARDIVGLSDGDPVTTWTDGSASGNDVTQATSGRRPVYKTNIIGSNPVVRFASANDKSLYATLASSWSGYSGVTLFMLSKANEAPGADFPGYFSMYTTANDFNNSDSFAMFGGVLGAASTPTQRQIAVLSCNSAFPSNAVGAVLNEPMLFGFALQKGSNGFKTISQYGAFATGDSYQIPGTPTKMVLGNRAIGGAVSTTAGMRFDVGMVLLYKEYMSDANIDSVAAWIIDEFSLTTGGGSGGGLLVSPGMTGGMNG